MPKQKTHKATKKRFRMTASGKLKHRSSHTSHLMSRRTQKRKRHLRGTRVVAGMEATRLSIALCGYSY